MLIDVMVLMVGASRVVVVVVEILITFKSFSLLFI